MIGRRELPRWWREFKGSEMPLGPYMLYTVVRVVGDKLNKRTNLYERKPIGTAFYVQVPSKSIEDGWYGYVVTAQHVVEGQPKPELAFPDPYAPGSLYPRVETLNPEWKHPIEELDVAVLPFARPDGYWLSALRLGKHLWEHLPADAMLAMPFHYIGLLEPLDRVMARSGTLGAVYQTGIEHPDGYEYAAHLGDCRSYRGFSGSPCFMEIAMPEQAPAEPPVPLPPGSPEVGRLLYLHLLCGMVTWHLEPPEDRAESSVFGVVTILTSDEIWRVLMSDELVEDRRKRDKLSQEPEAVAKNLGGGVPDNLSVGESHEFENFEDLATRLLQVPKKELDKKRGQ
jgi:hypothetical protein